MDSLYDALRRYRDRGVTPMHMPGHKRNTALFSMENPYGLDVTEIDGFDNLHDAHGILKEGMERAARLWGADKSWFLVNGSSCGILAAVCACTGWGDEILVARNCHKAVYHAIYQNNLRPYYLYPERIPGFEAAGGVSPEAVEAALEAHPGVKLVVLTSPTYEGVLSDVKAIADTAHRHGVPLFVDEAHGAHLGLAAGFPKSAVRCGADLVVQSVHKTLPSLTQTAVLHQNGSLVPAGCVERQLAIYETSSPSYLLMASIDRCVCFLLERGEEAFSLYRENLDRFARETASLARLTLLGRGPEEQPGRHGIFALDPSKLVVGSFGAGMTGPALMARLRKRGIELEMAAKSYAIAMTSLCDTRESLSRLAAALRELDGAAGSGEQPAAAAALPPLCPERLLTIREAESLPGRVLPLSEAIGKISRETVTAYPPGIPLLVPGERVDAAFAEVAARLLEAGVSLGGAGEAGDLRIEVVEES